MASAAHWAFTDVNAKLSRSVRQRDRGSAEEAAKKPGPVAVDEVL